MLVFIDLSLINGHVLDLFTVEFPLYFKFAVLKPYFDGGGITQNNLQEYGINLIT